MRGSGSPYGNPMGSGPGVRRPPNVKIADESPLPDVDREALPPGFQAPREIPSFLQNCQEWVLKPEETPTPKEKNAFNTFKSASAQLRGKEDADLVRKIIRFRLAEFTSKSKREQVYKLRDDLFIRELWFNSLTQPVKDVMLDALVAEAPTLFDYCLEPRFNAVLLLANLNVKEATPDGKQQAVPYLPACAPLVKLLNDPQQPDVVKIPAVVGAVRYAAPVATPVELKHKVVDALYNLLKNPNTDWWLQMRCAEGLGQIGFYKNLANQPVILSLLRDVVKDSKRDWRVRSEAARAIGRLNLEPNVDLKGIAVDLANFCLQMATEYQKSPKFSQWTFCMADAYFAFHFYDADEKKKGWGLLSLIDKPAFAAHKPIVTAAYQQCIPVIQNILTPPGNVTLPEALKNLTDWVKQNSPNGAVNIAPAVEQPKAKPPQVGGS